MQMLFSLLVETASAARWIDVGGLGVRLSFQDFSNNFTALLLAAAVILCIVLFLVGAMLMVISRGQQDQLQLGKEYMIRSLIGLGVVLVSYGIVQTVFYLLY